MAKKAEPKLTVAQKRDRDTAALIAGIQKDYEDRIESILAEHQRDAAKLATDNYLLGFDQGVNKAEAAYKAQSFIDRLLKKTI